MTDWKEKALASGSAQMRLLALFKTDDGRYMIDGELLQKFFANSFMDGAIAAVSTCEANGHNHSESVKQKMLAALREIGRPHKCTDGQFRDHAQRTANTAIAEAEAQQ